MPDITIVVRIDHANHMPLIKRPGTRSDGAHETELARLQEQITSIQASYGPDHPQLTIAKGYVAKLLGNALVVRYLMEHPTTQDCLSGPPASPAR